MKYQKVNVENFFVSIIWQLKLAVGHKEMKVGGQLATCGKKKLFLGLLLD
jgi:hypothetical protein